MTGPGQQPARDWSQQRQNWQDHRNQVREDWQNHRDQAREDWQGWFDNHYPNYGGWYWGHAGGYWGRWDYLWDNYPVASALGLTWWGANAIGSTFGYSDYSNPYCEEGAVQYTEPIVSLPVEAAAPEAPTGPTQEAADTFDQARAAFLDGAYTKALKLTDQAITKLPHDAVLHEFRSLVLFALKRYPEAAAAIHAVLAVGPGWDAKTLSGLYPDMDTYTAHLRALEAARDKNPRAADVRFLLGYHYLTCGYPDDALTEFRRAAELMPKDAVSASLVAQLSPRDAKPEKATDQGPAPKPVPPADLVGTWTAAGKGKYTMSLRQDGTFTWAFTRGSRKEEVKGVYSVEGNVLAMEPDTGGVMAAELTLKKPNNLLFKMIGGPKDDPGLDFRRASK
jgi:tetratricopeptide (TPR) repeat protein